MQFLSTSSLFTYMQLLPGSSRFVDHVTTFTLMYYCHLVEQTGKASNLFIRKTCLFQSLWHLSSLNSLILLVKTLVYANKIYISTWNEYYFSSNLSWHCYFLVVFFLLKVFLILVTLQRNIFYIVCECCVFV